MLKKYRKCHKKKTIQIGVKTFTLDTFKNIVLKLKI